MTATNILYTWLNTQNQANTMPGMKWMMYLMPVFFMVFFNNYAGGLSYYYFPLSSDHHHTRPTPSGS